MVEAMKPTVAKMLLGMERYNPENIPALERYVEIQSFENAYDLEANLALLKLYQFYPESFNVKIVSQILLKALTNLPHSDLTLCKCLLKPTQLAEEPINRVFYLARILEHCEFDRFWRDVLYMSELTECITGFMDSVRKFICNIVGTTYQRIEKTKLAQLLGNVDDVTLAEWVTKYGWKEEQGGLIFIKNLKDNIKSETINEKIEFNKIADVLGSPP